MKKFFKDNNTAALVKEGITYFFYIYTRPFYRHYFKKHKYFYHRFSPFKKPVTLGVRQCDRRTLVDFDRGFLFNRITKVASSALMASLRPSEKNKKPKKNHKRPSGIRNNEISKVDNLFKFVFVRNPYDRILSTYLHHLKTTARRRVRFKKPVPGLFKKYGESPTFNQFCRYLKAGGLYQDKHLVPQISLLALPPEEFDFIGKFENIGKDFEHIVSNIKFLDSNTLKHRGTYTGATDKRRRYYNRESANIVKSLYKEDFKSFKYRTDIIRN